MISFLFHNGFFKRSKLTHSQLLIDLIKKNINNRFDFQRTRLALDVVVPVRTFNPDLNRITVNNRHRDALKSLVSWHSQAKKN